MSSHKLVIKDALWQLFGRIISALFGFVITKIIASYLGPLRYGDYGTIFRFFARWTALVDFGIYVLAVKQLGQIKSKSPEGSLSKSLLSELSLAYGKFIGTRTILIIGIYTLAIITAYLIPAYTSNPFIIWGLPLAMCYSASNMFAGIQQLPLQIFWKMKRLTRSLIIARFSQIAILLPVVFFFFKDIDFSQKITTPIMILAFCLVVFSVVASSIGQNIEMYLRTKDLLPLKIKFDLSFTKDILKTNRKYGFSYFFSSFHTLLVLMFLGWFFPTASGSAYTGIWALALSLIEILLIIPSALGNSLLHKMPGYSDQNKRKSLGNLMTLIAWIGGVIAINFWIFADNIIVFVSSKSFLGNRESFSDWGSNQVLPFLGIVLFMSFIKQVYNYLFVALDKQNKLFGINLVGVLVGIVVGCFLIPSYGLAGGVVTQIVIELFFTFGAILVGLREKITPIFQKKIFIYFLGSLILFLLGAMGVYQYIQHIEMNIFLFLLLAGCLNLILFGISFPFLKKVVTGLTND